jgi:hypothetical protein
MLIRIRLRRGPTIRRTRGKERQIALALGSLLTPLAVMAAGLAAWRLGADLNWAGQFAISDGLFSHWQVWVAMAVILQFGATLLIRYGRGGKAAG